MAWHTPAAAGTVSETLPRARVVGQMQLKGALQKNRTQPDRVELRQSHKWFFVGKNEPV